MKWDEQGIKNKRSKNQIKPVNKSQRGYWWAVKFYYNWGINFYNSQNKSVVKCKSWFCSYNRI